MTDPMIEVLVASGIANADDAASAVSLPLDNAPLDSFFTWDDEDANAAIEHEWLIKEILSRRGVSMLWGPSGVGKGFIALEIAACVMSGEPFYGQRIKAPGGVLLALGEGTGSIPLRMKALRRGRFNNEAPADPVNGGFLDLKKLPLSWIDVSGLSKGAEFSAFADKIRYAKTAMEARTNRPLSLVILDTLNASFGFAEDADAARATNAMKGLSELGKELDLIFLVVHHAGKSIDAGETGSHAWRTSVEESLLVNGKHDNQTGLWADRRFTVIKARDGSKEGFNKPFSLQSVDLGIDSDGDTITSMIAVPLVGRGANDNAAAGRDAVATSKVGKVMRAFREVFELAGFPVESADGASEIRVCRQEQVQAAYLSQNPGKEDTIKKYFRTGWSAAKDGGLIDYENGLVWPVAEEPRQRLSDDELFAIPPLEGSAATVN
jgi:hypothetical protein